MNTSSKMDKDGILREAISDAGTKLFLTARILKAENYIKGIYEIDGEGWELSFTRIDNPQTPPNEASYDKEN